MTWRAPRGGPASRGGSLLSRLELVLPLGLCVAHAWVGLALLPSWAFTKYPSGAAALISGQLSSEQGVDYSPVYLLLNTLVSPQVLRWLQTALGVLAILAVYAAGRALAGRVAGGGAAFLLAASGSLLVYESVLEPEVLIVALTALGLALVAAALAGAGPGIDPKPPVRWALAALGLIALALASATRPSGLLVLVLVAGWLVWPVVVQVVRSPRVDAHVARAAGLVIGAAAAFLGPVLAIPLLLGGSVGATMSAGAVVHMGARPESTGLGGHSPVLLKLLERQRGQDVMHDLLRRLARVELGDAAGPSQVERYWLRKAAAFARTHPRAYGERLWRKAALFFFGPDAHDVREALLAEATLRQRLPLLWLDALGAIAVAGAAVALWVRRARWLVALLAAQLGMALVFYVLARYRLAALPVYALLGGLVLQALVEGGVGAERERRGVGRIVAALALVGALVLWLGSPTVRVARGMMARGARGSAEGRELAAALKRGDLPAATAAFVRTQGAQPFVLLTRSLRGVPFEDPRLAQESFAFSLAEFGDEGPVHLFMLATLGARAGRCAEVAPVLRALSEEGFRWSVFDRSLDPALLEMECLLERGDGASAFDRVRASLQRHPGTLDGLASAAAAQRIDPGLENGRFEEELFLLHDVSSARFALGRALNLWGAPAAALEVLDPLLAALPEAGVAHFERARALSSLGRHAEALQAYGRALRLFPGFAFPTRPLDPSVRVAIASAPTDAALVSIVLEHELRAGRVASALALSDRLGAVRFPELRGQVSELVRLGRAR